MKRATPAAGALLLLLGCWVFLEHGITLLTELVTGNPAPLPSSLIRMYMGMTVVGILVYHSFRDDLWQAFTQPLIDFLGDPDPPSARRMARATILTLIPILVGWAAYDSELAEAEPPADPPGIHFTLPDKYAALDNPLPWTEENIREGGILFTRNCAMCHGDALDGNGLFARAWQPRPSNFRDSGTIAQLDENYLFWRISEGGPGLPRGSIDYRSAMPVWEEVLSEEEIWKIIMFEYTNAGVKPARRE